MYKHLTSAQMAHVLKLTSEHNFAFNIERMNAMYRLPIVTEPSLDKLTKPNGDHEAATQRQTGFLKTLRDECAEGDEIHFKLQLVEANGLNDNVIVANAHNFISDKKVIAKLEAFRDLVRTNSAEAKKDVLVDIADWLSDIMVYCRSEGMKYGLPLENVLEVVMGSNFTKLPSDGIPIHDENGKFLKDMSNYVAPEGAIKSVLFGLASDSAAS